MGQKFFGLVLFTLERRQLKSMKKSRVFACGIIIITLISILFISCGSPGPNRVMLHGAASCSIPGMFCHDPAFAKVQVIEQDDYGRVLFSYTAISGITEQEQTAWVICQKHTDKYVYYYEDMNYSFSNDKDTVASLKQQNDWGEPLDERKFSVRQPKSQILSPGIYIDTDLERNKIIRAIKKSYDYNYIGSGICDADGKGNELWHFALEKDGTVQKFFVISNSEYEIYLLEIVNDTFSPEELHEFKVNSGWHFN